MVRFRYTAWDGTQRTELDADGLFAKLAEHLGRTDDLEAALDALLNEAEVDDSFELVGIDELLARIERTINELYSTYNLDHALDDPRRRLEELLELEATAAREADDSERAERLEALLQHARRDLAGALASLEQMDLEDADAAADQEILRERRDDIATVAHMVKHHGRRFHGPESVDLDGALELLERLRALEDMARRLQARDFGVIDPQQADELVGTGFASAVEMLGEMMAALVRAGYMTTKGGRMTLSPKGARRLGQLALREIHRQLVYDGGGRHETSRQGPMEVSMADSRRYRYGDPFHLNVAATVRNALAREPREALSLDSRDFEVFESTYNTRNATVLLLDMSWSMSWEGRFVAAKKVALAMETLMRTRYPNDYFAVVGFYTRAVELKLRDLPEVTWNMGDPFTNLQDGLRLGGKLLSRCSGRNKSMIVITDGQPTAYYSAGRLYCEWPMSIGGVSTRATVETLEEVRRITRQGVVINTFMLDDSPPLRSFVEKMTRINKGRAFYTTPSQLGRFLLVDYIGRRRRVI